MKANRLEGFHFRRQQVIDGFFVDFYCHDADLVIEVEGDIHNEQNDYDQERKSHLEGLGLRVLRLNNLEVECNTNRVLAEILQVCQNSRGKDR